METRKILIKSLVVFALGLGACNQGNQSGQGAAGEATPKDEPSQTEIYKFFDRQLGQTAKAGGYVNYKVEINHYMYAEPKKTTLPDESTVTAYPVKVDRTEYLTGFHHTYVSAYKGDEYRLYRDTRGNLTVLDHTAGQTETWEKPASNF